MHASAMFKALIALAAAISPVVADLAVTEPVATTTCTGGQVCNIAWRDNGSSPSLSTLGLCTVALYTGGRQQQTFLQPIAFPTPIDVSTTAAIQFTVDPTVGPNDNNYFIRFTSLNHTQTNTTGSPPYLSFSAKFILAGMTGTFNQTVLQQIAGGTSGSASASTASQTASSSVSRPASSTRATTATASTSTPNSGFQTGSSVVYVVGAAAFAGFASLF